MGSRVQAVSRFAYKGSLGSFLLFKSKDASLFFYMLVFYD